MIDDAANLVERVAYDAYGRSRHQWPADIDGDGDVDAADDAIMDALSGSFPIAITSGSYNADADIDRDGDVDSDDAQAVTDALTTAALAPGQLSDPAGPDNPIGYDGYVFNATDGTYTVRFRTYFPDLGRWGERDPLGYRSSQDLYDYCRATPLGSMDALGLSPPEVGYLPGNPPNRPLPDMSGARSCITQTQSTPSSHYTARGAAPPKDWDAYFDAVDTWRYARMVGTPDFVRHYYFGGGAPVRMSGEMLRLFQANATVADAIAAMNASLTSDLEDIVAVYCSWKSLFGTQDGEHIVKYPGFYRRSRNTIRRGYRWELFDVLNPLYALGRGSVWLQADCTLSIDCCTLCYSYTCKLRYVVFDRFRDPIDLGTELGGTPYEIWGEWDDSLSSE